MTDGLDNNLNLTWGTTRVPEQSPVSNFLQKSHAGVMASQLQARVQKQATEQV